MAGGALLDAGVVQRRMSGAAHWDVFSRPERQPKLGVGAPDTWWWDADKAKKIGL